MAKYILVVDDNVDLAELVATFLEDKGYRVKTSENGEDALLEMRDTKPSLVLMDNGLPKMSGIEVVEQMKEEEQLKQVPIIMITGGGDEKTVTRAIRLGITDFMVKPFELDELVSRIEKRMDSSLDFDLLLNFLKRIEVIDNALRKENGLRELDKEKWNLYPLTTIRNKICVAVLQSENPKVLCSLNEEELFGKVMVFSRGMARWSVIWPRQEDSAAEAA